jgi:hypothetical protein
MITGFNTDVDHDGRVFHVQTEDKGEGNPVIESLVYSRGEIIESRRTSYADLVAGGEPPPDQVLARMEAQHQSLIRDVRNGRFDAEGPKPFGHNIISGRSLDEVVLEFLGTGERLAKLRLELIDHIVLLQGSRPALRLRVCEDGSERPVERAQVRVQLLSTREQAREVFNGDSDADGFLEASFEIPDAPDADMAIVCQASAAGLRAELRQLVHRTGGQRGRDAKR